MTTFKNTRSNSPYHAVVGAPFGGIGIRLNDAQTHVLELVYLPQRDIENEGENELAQRAYMQVKAALNDPQFAFDLPLLSQGTAFQNKVWQVIRSLDAGETLTYKQVGQIIQCGAPRAVGGACGSNPYPLIVPCHRVVASHGIGGFAHNDDGFYVGVKRWLLAREGVVYD